MTRCPNCGEVVSTRWAHWQVSPEEKFRCVGSDEEER